MISEIEEPEGCQLYSRIDVVSFVYNQCLSALLGKKQATTS